MLPRNLNVILTHVIIWPETVFSLCKCLIISFYRISDVIDFPRLKVQLPDYKAVAFPT